MADKKTAFAVQYETADGKRNAVALPLSSNENVYYVLKHMETGGKKILSATIFKTQAKAQEAVEMWDDGFIRDGIHEYGDMPGFRPDDLRQGIDDARQKQPIENEGNTAFAVQYRFPDGGMSAGDTYAKNGTDIYGMLKDLEKGLGVEIVAVEACSSTPKAREAANMWDRQLRENGKHEFYSPGYEGYDRFRDWQPGPGPGAAVSLSDIKRDIADARADHAATENTDRPAPGVHEDR